MATFFKPIAGAVLPLPTTDQFKLQVDQKGVIEDIFSLDPSFVDESTTPSTTSRLWTPNGPTDSFKNIVLISDQDSFEALLTSDDKEKTHSAVIQLLLPHGTQTLQMVKYQITTIKSNGTPPSFILQGHPIVSV